MGGSHLRPRHNMALSLPTPDEFPIFPYSSPYDIQQDLMKHLFTAIEAKKLAIIESPTGTVRVN